jgi:ribosome recycling factor
MPIAESVNAVLSKMEEAMKERLDKLAREYSILRTGRANPMILDSIKIEYYGQLVPLKQVAAVSVPEARTLEIRPWDPSALADLDKALQKADLGAFPQNDGKLLRLTLPMMTEDRRRDMVKILKKIGEECRVSIRSERHAALDKIKRAEKAKEISEDETRGIEVRIQKITDAYVAKVDEQTALKEKEITTI